MRTRWGARDSIANRVRPGPLLFAAVFSFVPALARGQAIPTWGVEPEGPSSEPAPDASPPEPAEPPEPPPATIGTPAPGSTSASGTPPTTMAGAPIPPGGVVRAAGAIGLKYTLEGVEVRGNTHDPRARRPALRPAPRGRRARRRRSGARAHAVPAPRHRLLSRRPALAAARDAARATSSSSSTSSSETRSSSTTYGSGSRRDVDPSGTGRPLTAYGGAQVTETNLAGTGIALGGAFAVADGQLALRARLADPQFARSNWIAETELLYNSARDFFGNGGRPRQRSASPSRTSPSLQYKRFGGAPRLRARPGHLVADLLRLPAREDRRAAPGRRERPPRHSDVEPIDFMLLARLEHPVDPRRHLRSRHARRAVLADARPRPDRERRASLTPLGSDYPYAKLVVHGSQWFPLPWGHVLHPRPSRVRLRQRAALRALLRGRPQRSLARPRARPQLRSPPCAELPQHGHRRDPLRQLRREARRRVPHSALSRHPSVYGVDLFGSSGVYGLANEEDFVAPARGYQGFGTVPIDLSFNAGLRIDTQAGGFAIGLSNFARAHPGAGPDQGAAQR